MTKKFMSLTYESLLKQILNGKIDDFKLYTHEMEMKYNSDKKELYSNYEKFTKNISEDDKYDYGINLGEDLCLIDDFFIGMYRKSTLISLFSFFEVTINEICQRLYKINKFSKQLNDIKEKTIMKKYRKYLTKITGIDLSNLNKEWEELVNFVSIRNCIVHCEGDTSKLKSSKEKKKILYYIDKNPVFLSLHNKEKIKINREYINHCLNIIERFLYELYSLAPLD
jgi:hypothetical protein